MAQIKSLLNPTMDDAEYDSKDDLSTADSQTSSGSPKRRGGHDLVSRKKQKTVKDAAVFKPGTVREPCRYPPHEEQDDFLAAQHQMHEIYPMGSIADYPRHIPYNGGKKLFWEKTGRESFEGMSHPRWTIELYTGLWILDSFPVSIQDSQRSNHLHHALGLQHWTCTHYASLQVWTVF